MIQNSLYGLANSFARQTGHYTGTGIDYVLTDIHLVGDDNREPCAHRLNNRDTEILAI
jgi:hypothetical protein